MKCLKCRKNIPNNSTKCKYCGSKIKKAKQSKEYFEKKPKETKVEAKTEFLFTADLRQEAKKVKETTEILETIPIKSIKSRQKKLSKKELSKQKKENIKKQLEEFFNDNYVLSSEIPDVLFANEFKLQKKDKTKVIKTNENSFKDKLRNIKIKDILKKKKNKKLAKNKKKVNKPIQTKTTFTKAQLIEIKKLKQKRVKTLKLILTFCIIILGGFLIYSQFDNNIITNAYILKDNSSKRVFEMGEQINYKDVIYKIVKVETSKGTAYRKPKEGNQYLIVTIEFINKSNEKYHYSSSDWTMTNSLGEEKEKIISPVNAGHALYSGYLVIGGTKEASLVFEEPINDKDLKINYYDSKNQEIENPTNEADSSEKLDETEKHPKKPVFSVIIKVPKANEDKV